MLMSSNPKSIVGRKKSYPFRVHHFGPSMFAPQVAFSRVASLEPSPAMVRGAIFLLTSLPALVPCLEFYLESELHM